jgi:hypothetical protein
VLGIKKNRGEESNKPASRVSQGSRNKSFKGTHV